jgi:two-component system response regulator YesN
MIERSHIENIEGIYFTSEPLNVEDIVKNVNIDIIITDVRMPEITGLDLIKNINKLNLNIKFIVLSGYDDFSYVKEAFKLGAFDYILKPGSIDEIKSVIEKTIDKIKEEEKIKINQENNNNKYIEAILENRLNKIFNDNNFEFEKENVVNIFKELNITFLYSYFTVAVVSFKESINEGNIKNCLYEINKDIINKNELKVIYYNDFKNNFIFIFNYSSKINLSQIKIYIKKLLKELKENLNIVCFAAISEIGVNIESIIECYYQAMEAIKYMIIYDPFSLIEYYEISQKNDKYNFSSELNKIKEFILNYDTVQISNLIEILFSKEKIKEISINQINKLYRKIINIINDIAATKEVSFQNENYKEFNSFNSLSDLKIYLKTHIFEFINLLKKRNETNSISDIIKKYVQENYYKDIDMAVASNIVSLSYSHFSKIFKDETGMNFSDYLLKVRMEKALELLSDPTNKINDVSKSVGYNNPKHFTRAFKKYFGFLPSEYRGKNN